MTNARKWLEVELKSRLPDDWRVVGSWRDIDRIDRPTVRIGQRTIAPVDAAGYGTAHELGLVVSVASQHLDITRAEDALDDELLPQLIIALGSIAEAHWTSAELAKWQTSHLAYDLAVTLTVNITQKD